MPRYRIVTSVAPDATFIANTPRVGTPDTYANRVPSAVKIGGETGEPLRAAKSEPRRVGLTR